jgi:hypothetical protein
VVGSSFPPPSPPRDRRIFGQAELLADLALRRGDVFEFRMDRMADQAEAARRHAAFERALVHFTRRHDREIGLG